MIPLYFFPRLSKEQLVKDDELNGGILQARGLAGVFADVESVRAGCYLEDMLGTGPGGTAGTLLGAMPVSGIKPARIGYYPDRQDWTRFEGAADECYWVGIDRDYRIDSPDLARKAIMPGYEITLAGREWTVPVIRDPEGGSGLPCDWDLGSNGQVSERVREEYRSLWEDFAAVVDLFYDPEGPEPAFQFRLDRDRALRLCLDVLAINYRVGRAEQNLLHLVDSQNWASILALSVDLPTFRDVHEAAQEAKKKRDTGREPRDVSPATGPGSEDSDRAIDPAGESSNW